MAGIDDIIGRWIKKAETTGEIRSAESWGKPLKESTDYLQTPQEHRMGFKILKDAGYVPVEVELMQQLAEMRSAVEREISGEKKAALQEEIRRKQQQLDMLMDKFRS